MTDTGPNVVAIDRAATVTLAIDRAVVIDQTALLTAIARQQLRARQRD